MSAPVARSYRGVVISRAGRFAPPPQTGESERLSPAMTFVVLLGVLPMFAQCFHYLNELPPPYLLSKAWPMLALPLTVYGMARMKLPAKAIYLVFLAYAIGFTPLISMIQLGNGFFDALTTTIKIWPVTYYFALSALLLWLSPAVPRLKGAMLTLGYATYVIMLLLWLVAPASWYNSDPSGGKLMLFEQERGYRIYMPMFFGMILIFYLTRSFMQKPHWLKVAAVAVAVVLMLVIFKQRASIGAAVAVVGFGVLASAPQRLRRLFIGALCVLAPLAIGVLVMRASGNFVESLGGSLSVRQHSFALATDFLGVNVWNWLFGVGATTRFSTITLAEIFGSAQFFIADLGWVGVVFEYGAVGALLIAVLYGWGYVAVSKAAQRSRDPFAQALADYILFLIVTSAVYSLVLTPGELGVVMALAVYLDQKRAREPLSDSRTPTPAGPIIYRPTRRRMTVTSHAATAKKTVR
ncbi:hypothetical protein ABLE91_11150 [Aquabacter sp. CN5-332]|uniref:hypothetical protein n=1 Tax=Aquabacter sp. CN5-332 TaxID=3156608 RepID=UPI0032B38FBB